MACFSVKNVNNTLFLFHTETFNSKATERKMVNTSHFCFRKIIGVTARQQLSGAMSIVNYVIRRAIAANAAVA